MATFYERYSNGERLAVWDQLYGLEDRVNDDQYLADAQAVAAETMKRARHNVEMILVKLDTLGFQFLAPRQHTAADRQVVQTEGYGAVEYEYRVFKPPSPGFEDDLARVEEIVGMLPLSLAAWYEHVGEVCLLGDHPRLSSFRREIKVGTIWELVAADPLVVNPLLHSIIDFDVVGGVRRFLFPIAPVVDGFWEGIEVPNEGADGIYSLTGDRFVDYLRKSFKWGGFPGWRNYEHRPESELAHLAEGLLPI
jgi:hypothetical protein